jgi:cell pole-organizing protein PopZ
MSEASRLEYLAGQVAALNAFAIALTDTHPDREALQSEYGRLAENQVALSSPEPVSEAYLNGQQQTAEPLLANIAARVRSHG